jgi:hypothetical protein
MNIRFAFTRLTRSMHPVHPFLSYAMLVVFLLLLAESIRSRLTSPRWPDDDYTDLVLPLMLLFNHLAFMFNWRRRLAVALYVLALSWSVFGLLYVFFYV